MSQLDDLALAQELKIDDLANEVDLPLLTYVVSDVDPCRKIGDENGSRPIFFAGFPLDKSDFVDEICIVWVVIWCGAIVGQELSKELGCSVTLTPPPLDVRFWVLVNIGNIPRCGILIH